MKRIIPFITKSSSELARLHIHAKPLEPRFLNSAINENLNRIILKILSKESSARYRTADQLGRVLLTFSRKAGPVRLTQPLSHLKTTPQHETPKLTPRHSPNEREEANNNPLDLDWITIGLGLLALIAGGGLIPFWLWVYFSLGP